jgi:hypothetical protein
MIAIKDVTLLTGLTMRKSTNKEKLKGLVTAKELYEKYDVDIALEKIEKEAERRVRLFAKWLIDKGISEDDINSYCNNIFNSLCVITQHEPPYMFLAEVKDDITKGRINKGESYGSLFKYHIFLDAIKETYVDEKFIKALRHYFTFLNENNFIKKTPNVVEKVFEKEEVYLRRLKEHHESNPEDEQKWMIWWNKWCKEVFRI